MNQNCGSISVSIGRVATPATLVPKVNVSIGHAPDSYLLVVNFTQNSKHVSPDRFSTAVYKKAWL